MKSPFAGMDPYIEGSRYWGDFHNNLIALIQQHLADTAPPGYYVRTETREHIEMVEQEGKKEHVFVPDASIESSKPKKPKRGGGPTATATTEADPLTMRAFITERHRERFVEIYQGATDPRLVTVIEVLSATNKKPGSVGRRLYLRKRESFLLGDVNLVEIDLLRDGERMPMVDSWPDSPYVLTVGRVNIDHYCEVYRGYYDRPLPSLPVPLLEPDPDLRIDLQPMVDTVYRCGKYHESLDYTRVLDPPLPTTGPPARSPRLKRRKS
jgi:hypothetical protein